MNDISVCTIYANRKLHLQNLVEGLIRSQLHPDELVIVCMNDRLPNLPETPFTIKTACVNTDDGELPLAVARNKAAAIATGDLLIFLDVDCISDRHLIDIFNYHLQQEDALYSGSVRYLHSGWQNSQTKETLDRQSAPNKLQGKEITGKDKISHPYELFWSLCFGIKKQTFNNISGFDPRYKGYGGEDTDFAYQARSHDLPCYKISALAYHQFHPSYSPPLNHLAQIVSNARVFYHKWKILPMEKWLVRFADMGYIRLANNEIEILKYPTEAEIQSCIKDY